MIPLNFANVGCKVIIKRVGGIEETRRFLGNLGFVEGGEVSVISENNGNLIVGVKDSRVAISREMATKIIVSELIS